MQQLADQGYTTATLRTYDGTATLFCQEVARRGLRKGELVGRTLSKTHAAALKAMHPNKYNQKRYCLERFIDALVEAGVAERQKREGSSPVAIFPCVGNCDETSERALSDTFTKGGWQKVTRLYRRQQIPDERWLRGLDWCLAYS